MYGFKIFVIFSISVSLSKFDEKVSSGEYNKSTKILIKLVYEQSVFLLGEIFYIQY